VVWDADFAAAAPDGEPALAEAISGIYRSSLAELKEQVER